MKKRNAFSHILIMLTVVGIVISFICVPAFAQDQDVEIINYKNYIGSRDVSGADSVLYLDFPVYMNRFTAYAGVTSYSKYGVNPFTFKRSQAGGTTSEYARVLYKPIDSTLISLANVPTGTSLGFDYIWKLSTSVAYNAIMNGYVRVYYYDKDYDEIDNQFYSFGTAKYGDPVSETSVKSGTLHFQGEFALTPPDGARYFNIFFYLGPQVSGSLAMTATLTYELTSQSSLYLKINTDYVNGETDRETNELMGELVDQNNSMINGTPEQNNQVSQDVNQMQGDSDRLEDLTGSMEVEKPDTNDIDVSLDNLVPYENVLSYTAPFLVIWENDTLLSFLIIVLTLVLISYVMFGKK